MRFRFALLVLLSACRGAEERPAEPPPPRVVAELKSVEGPHDLARCLSELGASYREAPDGILFFERGSKIAVAPPRRPRAETYHVHLLHRAEGRLVDHLALPGEKGTVDLDLAPFAEPEALVVTSSALRVAEVSPGGEEARPAEGLAPPYALGFRLVRADQWEGLVRLQPFRYELETPQGTLYAFVQSFNRRDMLLSWLDPEKSLQALIQEDPYVYLKRMDGVIPPRLVVEVRTAAGVTWQRAGTWHMPEGIDRTGPEGDKPFFLRTADRELLSFGPPPRIDLELPREPATTAATVSARFTGVSAREALKFVLACSYPTRGPGDLAARVQTHDVTAARSEGSYTVALDHLDPGVFPLTSAISHRFVHAWRFPGGLYRPVPPLGRVVLAGQAGWGPRHVPSRVVLPRYASHYDFLAFFGAAGGKKGRTLTLAEAYDAGGQAATGTSPNLTPPPPGGSGPGAPAQFPPLQPVAPAGPGTDGGTDGDRPRFGIRFLPTWINLGRPRGPDPKPPPPGGWLPDHVFVLDCPPGPKGCEMIKCSCPDHDWSQNGIMNAVSRMFSNPAPADASFFGPQGGKSPCHQLKHVGTVRVSYWTPNCAQVHFFFNVYVTFRPCQGEPGKEEPVGGKKVGVPVTVIPITPMPADPNSPSRFTPTTVTVAGTPTAGPLSITSSGITADPGVIRPVPPYNDPMLTDRGNVIGSVLGGRGVLPTWTFALSDEDLSALATGFGLTYHGRPPGEAVSGAWNPNLPYSWGVYLQGVGGLTPTTNGTAVPGGGGPGSPPVGIAPGVPASPPPPPPPGT